METNLHFEEKMIGLREILTYLETWQSQSSGNNGLAVPTFRAFTQTITNLCRLQQEMIARGITIIINTAVLSTLIVEHSFSISRGILPVCNNEKIKLKRRR